MSKYYCVGKVGEIRKKIILNGGYLMHVLLPSCFYYSIEAQRWV